MQDDINIPLWFPVGWERKHETGQSVQLQQVVPDWSDLMRIQTQTWPRLEFVDLGNCFLNVHRNTAKGNCDIDLHHQRGGRGEVADSCGWWWGITSAHMYAA